MNTACFATTLALFVANLANNALKREVVVLIDRQRRFPSDGGVFGRKLVRHEALFYRMEV